MGEDLQRLEQDYCPPIDPALLHAIYHDYADTPNGMQLARELLDSLKQAADIEQDTGFDPSGSSGDVLRSSPGKESDEVESNAESWATRTTVTNYTNLSNDLSTLSLEGRSESDGSSEGGYFRDTERFDTPTKEALLADTFPTLRPEFVARTLKKCGDDFSKATDELLNHVYFEGAATSPTEEAVPTKGVDAFAEGHHVPHRRKKGKSKTKQRGSHLYDAGSVSASECDMSSPASNKWADGNRDIDFIASRTKFPCARISSLYHTSGASLPATIVAVLNKYMADNQKEKEPDTPLVLAAIELTSEFPTIDYDYAIALLRISSPSTVNAHELAKALTIVPGSGARKSGIEVIPHYAPIDLSDPSSDSSQNKLPSLPPSALPRTTASLSAARGEAFTQASAAYRKGKSTPLMKSVAGYYAQVGRDLNASLKAVSEVDADALVSSQSSSKHLDLHGVSVQSATRIAKERTQTWWDGLGEARIPGGGRRGVGEGYRIVTGLGRHSEGGRGKIGPAVVRTLVKEGWKIEVGTGELLVVGLARRR